MCLSRRVVAMADDLTAAQATINPLLEDYGYTVAKAAAVQDLLTAAQEAGLKITPELRQNMDSCGSRIAKSQGRRSAQLERKHV